MKTLPKVLALALLALGLAVSSKALPTVSLATQGVGYLTPTVIPPTGVDVNYLNNMINTFNGTAIVPDGETYTKVQGSNTPNTLSLASSLAPDTSVSGSPTSFNIDLGSGGYLYLVAQWDGPNGTDAVYYIGNLSGQITLTNDVPGKSQYGLSGYWFSNTTTRSVPDGGATVGLLGAGLLGLALFRRRLLHT